MRRLSLLLLCAGAIACSGDDTVETRPQTSSIESVSPASPAELHIREPSGQSWDTIAREGGGLWWRTLAPTDAFDGPRVEPELLPDGALPTLAGSPVPVLLPHDPDLLASAQPTVGPTWYAVSMRVDDLTVFIQGNAAAHVRPALAEELAAEGYVAGEPQYSRIHLIPSVTFEALGATYLVDVECGVRPDQHPVCADFTWLEALVEDFAVLEVAR